MMLQRYKEWADKAMDYAVIGDRALILLGDSAEILRGTTLRADSAIMDPPYDFDASGGAGLFARQRTSYFHDLRERGLTKGFDFAILDAAALADQCVVFFHNDQLYKIVGHLTEPRNYLEDGTPANAGAGEGWATQDPPLYPRFVLCAWSKDNPMPVANKHYVPDTENYIHAWRSPAHPTGTIAELRRVVFAPVGKSEYDHPTVKPQKVMRKIITNASKPGDVVLDPFAGSGSTGVAALALGRLFVGIEKDPGFFKICVERCTGAAGLQLSESRGQDALF